MMTRREMIAATALAGGGALLGQFDAKSFANEKLIEPVSQSVGGHAPVYTPNGVTLPVKISGGIKIMHLIAGEIEHEFAPGLTAHCWGYNGRTPGPTIEAVEGDHLRIYVTNHLPVPTTVHWHGIRLVNGMDGVNGLTQTPIPPGQTFRYEFTVPQAGTFMYHPHFDEMTQQAMGMMGMFVVHPQSEPDPPDRDYAIMLSEWRIDPGASRPVTTEMTDFNIFTMNSKVYPATQPIVARLGERVRLRFGNLSAMDHHPIHLHGFQMILTETDGGIIQPSARYAANTILVPVGSTRAADFLADNPGDWAMHCHMSHHTMNQMGHPSVNMIGANSQAIDKAIAAVVPSYMTMGTPGMEGMNEMQMPSPTNSIPMLGGVGQFGTIDMGGMFTILKVREHLSGYGDPGDYRFPLGTVAMAATAAELRRDDIEVNVQFENSPKSRVPMMPMVMPTTAPNQGKVLYTCVMHPQIISDKPGKCPICGMTLIPKKN